MEEVLEFMYNKIECEKPTVNELLALVAERFKSDLAISDVTFIKRKYSEIIARLWERECEEKLNEIITDGEIDGRKILEIIKIVESEDIHKVQSIFNNRSLDLIESETDQENFHSSCKKILNVIKRKVKSVNENLRKDLEFFDALIELLRNFFIHHDEFVDKILMLNEFLSEEKLLYNIAKRVSKFTHKNEYFNKLKVKAVNYPNETSILEDYIRDEIKKYVAKVEVNSNNKIFEIKKKFLTSSDIIKHYENENEVHIICDILLIEDNLPESFCGKNIAIYANNIHIHKASKWNLSGVKSKSAYSSNAGQTLGKGNDGDDGYAGESGGNICVECKSITNASDWTIISNGGNGSDGQNGGDGTDGKDGKDANTSDFKIQGADFKISSLKLVNFDRIVENVDMIIRWRYKCGYKRFHEDEFVKDLWIYQVPMNICALLFVKGTDGEIGKSGGLAGRGGEGGISGEISIKTLENYSSSDVRKSIPRLGNNGKNGFAGHNGLNGKDGRDLGCFDSSWSNEYVTIGDDGFYKYEIKYSKSYEKHSVWHEDEKAYASMSHKSTVSTTTQINRQRNETKTEKSLQLHAKATKKSPILMHDIKIKNSSYLKTLNENMRSIVNKYGCVSTDITTNSCTSNVANVRFVYQVHYDKSETIINNSKKIEVEIFNFDEIKALIQKGITAIKLIGILETNEYDVNDLKSFKELLNDDTSIIESKSQKQIINTEFNEKCNILPTDAEKLIPYLNETNDFENNFRDLFIKNSNENKDGRRKVFARYTSTTINKSTSEDEINKIFHCLTSIFHSLIYHQDELPEIKNTLMSFRETFEKGLDIKIASKEIKLDEKKLRDGFEIVSKFFAKDEIQTFVKEDITKNGLFSPIYRKLIAYEFGVNIKIFVRNIQQSFVQIENHNENAVEQVFLLMSNEKFSKLKFNMEKFRVFYIMEQITIDCARKFSNIQKSDDVINMILHYSLSQAEKFTFVNLFDIEKCWMSQEHLIELIMRKFVANQFELDELRLYLKCISKDNEISILKAINVRFYNESVELNLKEFLIIIMTILSLISEHEYLIKYFTFLLLSHSNSEWFTELILLSTERKISTVSRDNKISWRKLLNDVKYKEILVLFLSKISEIEDDMCEDDFCKIINFLKYLTMANYQHLLKIELKLWQYEMTTEYWMNELKSIMPEVDEDDLQLKEILNKLQSKYNKEVLRKFIEILSSKKLDVINKFNIIEFLTKFVIDEWIFNDEVMEILMQNNFCDWMTKLITQYDVKEKQRSVSQIVHLVIINSETSPFIQDSMNNISDQANKILQKSALYIDLYRKQVTENDDGDNDSCLCNNIKKWIKKQKSDKEKFNLIEAMAHIITAFQFLSKNKIMLRHTQIISILNLWNDDESTNGTLIQIGTGEGKTFVAIALAILKVLDGQNVDIITSSSVLAERDANSKENRKIFETFGITVDHNCYEDTEKRKAAYKNCNVIYGVLNNFQRDYLLTEFYGQNFLSNHHFQNVIVDEVDSMLLDKGNNILYLSQDLPDIDEIESVFTFIWQWINQTTDNMDEMLKILRTTNVRKILLDNAYGLIEEALIKRMLPAVNSSFDCKNIMWNLQLNKIIDDEGVIILEKFNDNKIQSALTGCCSQEVANKIKFIIKEKIEYEKQVKIPKYLKKFVMLHLNKWIENAIRALSMENNNQFTIDRERSGTMSNFEPNVIIVDLDTGTDQSSSQWDEGLHQFLQLKYGCKLSLTSLKSVFISNVSYFKMYKKLCGLSGTLGAMQERKKLENLYELNYLTIPSYLPKRFFESESIMTRNSEDWLEEIKKEVLSIFDKNRSVLIICETIKNLEIIRNKIKDDIWNVFVYKRDYEKIIVDELQPRTLILSTNLAGRGTDIPLSSELKSAGGLHVILTYLAANIRIENQAFGRASRAGDDGTGRLIICSTSDDHISIQKQMRDYNESVRLENISAYYENFISVEEKFFKKFRNAFKNYSSLLDEKLPNLHFSLLDKTKDIITDSIKNECNELKEIFLENFKIKWAFWLDENSMLLEEWENVENESMITSSFKNFLSKFEHVDYKKVEFHPISRLKVFKWFVKNERLEEAKEVLQNDFQDDSIAYNYYSTCIDLMINQEKNNNEHRDLSEYEEQSLKLCLNHLNNRDHLRSVRNYTMNAIKEKFKSTLIPIEAYKKQQNSIAEFERIFVNNIQELLGKSVTPQTFHSTLVSNELIKNEIYDSLVDQNFINDIKISSVLIDKNIEKIARKYQISTNELNNFLKKEQSTSFKSFDGLSKKLKSFIKFPSRELFWKSLLKLKILANEEKFAVIDLIKSRNVDPSEVERFFELFKDSKLKALPVDKVTQVYMDSIDEDNEAIKDENNKIAVTLKILKSKILRNKYNNFRKHDCIKIHKRAYFDLKIYKSSKLNEFDQITVDDFKSIIAVPTDIIKSLCEQKILNENHQLNYENFKDINLGENFVYQTQICDLISRKFAFRIALEILAMKINENIESESLVKNEKIHLHSQPHLLIIHDLIENSMIDGRKVNSSKIDEIKFLPIFTKFLSLKKISNILAKENIHCDLDELKSKNLFYDLPTYIRNKYKDSCISSLIRTVTENETCQQAIFLGQQALNYGVSNNIPQAEFLKNIILKIDSSINEDESLKKLIDSEPIRLIRTQLVKGPFVINNFNVNEMNLSEKYSQIEKTIRLLLQNRRIIVENKNDLINRIKQSAMPLRDESFENPEFVFKSIDEVYNPDDMETLNFMKLKGLDLILKIKEKKWTRAYFIRLTVVMMAGVIQIAIGVAITILSRGINTKIGQTFISEGINDIIFAMNTLKTGHFRWSDYGKHKMISLITTVSMFGATVALSKMNMFKNYFALASSTYGDKVAGNVFDNMSGWALLKQSAKKEMWRAFYKDVAVNSIKAISIAGVSMGVDKFVEQKLGMITLSISSIIVDTVKNDFEKHKLTDTIDELLQLYTIGEAENIINARFKRILDNNEYYRQMATEIGDKIDQIIQSGNGINKIITTFSTITAKTFAITSMAVFISNILDELNFELINQIQSTLEEQKVSKPTDDEILQFKLKVSQDIQKQLVEQMKTVVNRNIISPTLNYAANLALSKAASEAVDVYKPFNRTKDETIKSEDVKKLGEELSKSNKKENLNECEKQEKQFVENKALEILKNTTNPFVYAQLNRLDIPLTNIDIEGAAILINSKLNKNVKIVIKHEGIEHTFGSGEEVIKINYANSKHSFNNVYLFNTMAKTFPELKDHFNAQTFRYEIAETMKTNDEIKAYITDKTKKFFFDIGFYGGNPSNH